jgi:hypothetical protein
MPELTPKTRASSEAVLTTPRLPGPVAADHDLAAAQLRSAQDLHGAMNWSRSRCSTQRFTLQCAAAGHRSPAAADPAAGIIRLGDNVKSR